MSTGAVELGLLDERATGRLGSRYASRWVRTVEAGFWLTDIVVVLLVAQSEIGQRRALSCSGEYRRGVNLIGERSSLGCIWSSRETIGVPGGVSG